MNKDFSEEISFGDWVRQRRRMLDLTQQELANRVGCARITLRRIEAGTLKPSKELAQILLEKLGAPPINAEAWLQFARGLSGFPESSPSTNLPALLTTFIGREKEIDEVANLLTKHRLVTLAGAGGIGKTRLALQVGRRLLSDYPQGVWFIAFDSLSDPTLVLQTVATVFDIREGSSNQPLLERLIYSLHTKITLLIMDNCEHLLDACSQLMVALLTHCPNLTVLSTSREIFNMEGEAIYYAPTLSIPEQGELSLEKISDHESIQLFNERAALVLPSFHLTADNMQTAVNICRRVDGIPLAIEMAAARVDILQVDEILRQLQDCFDLLVGRSRAALPRHQTMRASMDWSWGLLTEPEQKFMRQLSIFAGGWTLDSAQTVCEGGNTLDLASALVKKSLIRVKQHAEYATRYQFHEIVRQYTCERLLESGEEDFIRTRHLRYFLKLSEEAEPALRGPAQIEWMAKLSDELDNIRAALTWADETDVEAGLYLTSRFGRLWENLNVHEESHWLSIFLQKPEAESYPRARALALYSYLPALNYMNQVAMWRSTSKKCIELCRELGYQSIERDIRLMSAEEISDVVQRSELFQQALKLAETSSNIWRKARTFYQLGWHFSGDQRLVYWERAIILFRQIGDWRELAQCLATTAHFAISNEDLDLAQRCLDEATQLNNKLKNKEAKSSILYARTQIAIKRGDYKQAHAYSQEELEITEELGARMRSLWSRSQLGYLTLREGSLSEAKTIFTATAREFFNDKNEIGVVFNLEGIAALYVAIKKSKLAAQLIGWADATREKINDKRPLIEQKDVDKTITACLEKIGEVAFSEAYDEGQKMTLDEAVAYALNES